MKKKEIKKIYKSFIISDLIDNMFNNIILSKANIRKRNEIKKAVELLTKLSFADNSKNINLVDEISNGFAKFAEYNNISEIEFLKVLIEHQRYIIQYDENVGLVKMFRFISETAKEIVYSISSQKLNNHLLNVFQTELDKKIKVV